jgi:hypothetical protein
MILSLAACGGGSSTRPDTTPPAPVADLAVVDSTTTTLTLRWTAPGDDGSAGTASAYDLRSSTAPITSSNFNSASQVPGALSPRPAGSQEMIIVTGLPPLATYYFALVSQDEASNRSGLSNVASGRTASSGGNRRVFHATPDGSGSDCGTLQECLDAAADGDTVELAAGIYNTVADTLVEGGPLGRVTANMVVKSNVVIRAARAAQVRVDGQWDEGRIGMSIPDAVSEVTVTGIRFDNCAAAIRAAGGRLHASGCTFVSGTHGLVADGTELDVRSCSFEEYATEAVVLRDCSGRLERCEFWGNGYAIFAAQSRSLLLERILVAFACFTAVRIEEGGEATLDGVTITGSGMAPGDSSAIVVAGGASATIRRSIAATNRGFGVDCRTGGLVQVSCSDMFMNSAGNYNGCPDPTGMDGNLASDPLFCNPSSVDFRLQPGSPARNSPCGAMGAFGDEACAGF